MPNFCPECGTKIRPHRDGSLLCPSCDWTGSVEQVQRREVVAVRESAPGGDSRSVAIMAAKEILAPIVVNMAKLADAIGTLQADLGGIRREMGQARQDRQEGRRGATTSSEWDEHIQNQEEIKRTKG
jgi:uncharacterized Zn finger protein (UPF0148 family)